VIIVVLFVFLVHGNETRYKITSNDNIAASFSTPLEEFSLQTWPQRHLSERCGTEEVQVWGLLHTRA
jgi:hypothetical protein